MAGVRGPEKGRENDQNIGKNGGGGFFPQGRQVRGIGDLRFSRVIQRTKKRENQGKKKKGLGRSNENSRLWHIITLEVSTITNIKRDTTCVLWRKDGVEVLKTSEKGLKRKTKKKTYMEKRLTGSAPPVKRNKCGCYPTARRGKQKKKLGGLGKRKKKKWGTVDRAIVGKPVFPRRLPTDLGRGKKGSGAVEKEEIKERG